MNNLEKEISKVADLFEYGHLLADTDPAAFFDMIEKEIKKLRESLKCKCPIDMDLLAEKVAEKILNTKIKELV
jgi:hypothetical protein